MLPLIEEDSGRSMVSGSSQRIEFDFGLEGWTTDILAYCLIRRVIHKKRYIDKGACRG